MPSDDEPSYKHLEALIELLRSDLREAVSEIKTSLASRVDVAVYQADQRRIDQEIANVRGEIDEIKTNQHREKSEHQADRRSIASALVGAGLSLLIALIVLALQLLTG